ncbi:hypothetical protein [Aeromicrobium fastidiosum]|uniref:CHAP domain-containing protein n=1 Tax=Aeromicrobium fastidiosum TaxID=52699 RepID=A0A641AQZ4_9ACTN|nr:hypothetical protein [Aeromicrobium fastidiosum]KAA1380526.1 hypothetical protein ESP62_004940 [Aeromicrobium fastidiosum]MBP2390118.1 hypothetical protein [Aeromicrobium fastidiosum]
MARTIYAPGLNAGGTRPRALAWVGRRFSPGWCLYWCLTQVFKVPGLGDYDHDGSADAEDYWKAAVARGKAVKSTNWRKFPPGVLLMWTGGRNDHGHAAYCLGNGEMVSTDLPTYGTVGRCSIDLPRRQWGLTLVGYVLVDGNGFTLTRETDDVDQEQDDKTVKLPKPVKYTVTKPGGLKGRAGPSDKGKVVWTVKEGHTVVAVAIVTGSSRKWAVNKNGTHYPLEHLVEKP